MTRNIAPAFSVSLTREVVIPVFLFKMEFTSTTLYLCSLPYNISYDSQTWLGNGMLREIEDIDETMELSPTGSTIRLGALDSSLMSLLLGSTNQTKRGFIYLGGYNSVAGTLLGTLLTFKGFFDSVSFTETEVETIAQVTFENDLIKLNRQKEIRYTDQSQQSLFAGDLGFQYVSAAEDWTGFWGTAPKVKRIRKRKLTSGTR